MFYPEFILMNGYIVETLVPGIDLYIDVDKERLTSTIPNN